MRSVNVRKSILLLAFACLSAGCTPSSVVDANTYEQPGLLAFYNDTSSIIAPETVQRGVAFIVEFRTFGGGCTRSVSRTHVGTFGLVSLIQPFNRTTRADGCTRDLLVLRHVARVRIDEVGTATIRVIGEQRGASDGAANLPIELRRSVVVR